MPAAAIRTTPAPSAAPLLGDHLAMDLLNTEVRSGGTPVDFLTSGDAVLTWLARNNIVPAAHAAAVDHAALLAQALALRSLTRELVIEHKAGEHVDLGPLNVFLQNYISAPHIQYDTHGRATLTRVVSGDPVASLLGPVAQALAQLLVEERDFALVKQCEHPDCILWFYDRTKAHKRRWCSMALCGNRYKAAQFRKKINADAA